MLVLADRRLGTEFTLISLVAWTRFMLGLGIERAIGRRYVRKQ